MKHQKFNGLYKTINYMLIVLFLLFTVSVSKAEETKQEEKITGSVSAVVYNRYVFRGYDLSSGSVVIQPSITLFYKGFSVNYWENIYTNEKATQSFVPDRPGRKSFNESDLTLRYTYTIDKLSITGGYIYYRTKYADETEEVFLTASYDVITKPTLTIYRDISTYTGTYINLSLSHSLPVYKDIILDVAASFGYFKGDDSYWKSYESSTGDYTGKKYSGFHDGKLQAGFTIPIAKNLTVQPMFQYWFPLSSKAKRIVDGSYYNPNGHLDDTWVTGINITFSF